MNRQNRVKPERRARPLKGVQREIADNPPLQVYSTVGGSMPLLDNVLVIDKNMLVPMEVQRGGQPRQQFVNLDHQFVRPPTQNNVQILQNIAIRPPIATSATGNSNSNATRRYQQQQQPNTTYATAQPRVARNISTLPPGGHFLAVQRGVPTPVVQQPSVQLQRSSSNVSLLQDRPPVAPPSTALHGRLPMMNFKDYPEYKIIMHEFCQQHKSTMFRLSTFVHNIFNPLLVANGYVLLVSLNYAQFICFEVDAKIFGDFICRLVPRMLEMCNVPFVLELKDAPSNWSNELKKSIVIGKNNYELAARKIAECFRNKEVVTVDIPQKLEVQFIVRRNFIGIKIVPARETMDGIRAEFTKRYKALSRYRDRKLGKCETGTQTEYGAVLPSNVMLQYKMQLEMVISTQNKRLYRDAIQLEHTLRMEQTHRQHTNLLEDIENKVASLLDAITERPKPTIRQEVNWEKCRTKEVQTDAPPAFDRYEELQCPVLTSIVNDEYIMVMKQLIEFSVLHHKRSLVELDKLQKENDLLYAEFRKKNSDKNSDKRNHRSRDKNDNTEEKKPDRHKDKEENRTDDKKMMEAKNRRLTGYGAHKESSAATECYKRKPLVSVVPLSIYLDAYKDILNGGSVPEYHTIFEKSDSTGILPGWEISNVKDLFKLENCDVYHT